MNISKDDEEKFLAHYAKGYGMKSCSIHVWGKHYSRRSRFIYEKHGLEKRKLNESRGHSEGWKRRRTKTQIRNAWNKGIRPGRKKAGGLPLFQFKSQEMIEDDRKRYRERYKNDLAFRAKELWKRRLKKILYERGLSTRGIKALGCTNQQLKSWIESHWEPWMNWDNVAFRSTEGWQVDHVVPCSWFDHRNPNDVKLCWNYQNLRPLCAKENNRRSNKGEGAIEWLTSIPQTQVTEGLIEIVKSRSTVQEHHRFSPACFSIQVPRAMNR